MLRSKIASSGLLFRFGVLAIMSVVGQGCSPSAPPAAVSAAPGVAPAAAGEQTVPVSIGEGHEIGERDFGRPVALIAAGLGVEPDVFREAFSGVTPAHGRGPTGDEARKNKAALMKVLAPHGVTNERLDEVSNYYRFRPQNGELWPTKEAQAHAVIVDGQIKEIIITEPGSGYCSEPFVWVKGHGKVNLSVTLAFSKDLPKNGSIARIEVLPPLK